MAQLTITTLDDSGGFISTPVQIYLSDVYGNAVRAFTSGGLLVQGITTVTNIYGVLVIDLIPNAEIATENTYYTVRISNRAPILILKNGSAQTLEEASVTTGEELGSAATLDSLVDVEVADAIVGDVLRKDASGFWEPYSLPSGSLVSYRHDQGVAAMVWTINHALGRHPVIDILDSSNRVMFADIVHNSNNQATVTLLTALTGTAECR